MRTLLTWLFGFVTARMVGSEPEALLNQCAQRSLTLWKMERLDPVTLLVKVPAIQWRRVEALAERMGCQAEDVQRRGVPCFLGRFRRRYGLLVGLVLYNQSLFFIGIVLFSFTTLFQLVTLPVEFNASARAIATIDGAGLLDEDELPGAKKVLRAAALTYVAALLMSLLQLMRFVLIFIGRGGRDQGGSQ